MSSVKVKVNFQLKDHTGSVEDSYGLWVKAVSESGLCTRQNKLF